MNLLIILIVILLLCGGGVAPVWGHSTGYGWYPASGLFGIVLLLIVLRVFGVI